MDLIEGVSRPDRGRALTGRRALKVYHHVQRRVTSLTSTTTSNKSNSHHPLSGYGNAKQQRIQKYLSGAGMSRVLDKPRVCWLEDKVASILTAALFSRLGVSLLETQDSE